jgi:hypothetical protein
VSTVPGTGGFKTPFAAVPGLTRVNNPAFLAVDEILGEAAQFRNDPLNFVYWNYPWATQDTILEKFSGPDQWQVDTLGEIGEELIKGAYNGCLVQKAIRSGHGTGKSALVGMLCDWALTTMARTRGVVTAMTEPQLRTKTWPEIAKWHSMSMAQYLFEVQGRSIIAKGVDQGGEPLSMVWRIDAVPWSVQAPSAFAGLHNFGRRILLIFDEASEIDDEIWRVSRGALTDKETQIVWLVMGQPTQTSGEFFRCFMGNEWSHRTLDSRNSRFVNQALLQSWKDEYGEDSDFFRVRVRGLPPRAGISNFIPLEWVQAARRREVDRNMWISMPKRMSVDPARFGDDTSVITLRQGMHVLKQWSYSGLDGPDLAARAVTEVWQQFPGITGCAVDAIGIGASCCDALRRVRGFPLLEVNVAAPAVDEQTYFNLRAELWGRMRKWLETGEIPDDEELEKQLTNLKYGFDNRSRIQLQSKKDLKGEGYPSPDKADSLALSFYEDLTQVLMQRKAPQLPSRTRPAIIWNRRL